MSEVDAVSSPAAHPCFRLHNARALAWIGDAEFEVRVRRALYEAALGGVDRLHTLKSRFVSAAGQAALLERLESQALPHERDLLGRAVNTAVGAGGKRHDVRVYRRATALEAWVGALYVSGQHARIDALLEAPLRELVESARATLADRAARGGGRSNAGR